MDLLEALTQINLQDVYDSLGLGRRRSWAAWVFGPAARRFARVMEVFNRQVRRAGAASAAQNLLRRFGQSWSWPERRPARQAGERGAYLGAGPALWQVNHPGMTDTLALLAWFDRPDVRILALDRPFLRALDSLGDRLIFIDPNSGFRALRPALDHLRSGGHLVTFPAGRIEADPALKPSAAQRSRRAWSSSASFFQRLVPNLRVETLVIQGVIDPGCLKAAQVFPFWAPAARGRLAAVLQLLRLLYAPPRLKPRLDWAKPAP